jgi:heterodisulfide reductase subunit A
VCISCGACELVCPANSIRLKTVYEKPLQPLLSEFEMDLKKRPSIYIPFPQALPNVPVIDRSNCVHFKNESCGICSEVCPAGAIDYLQKDEEIIIKAGAVILSPGFCLYDAVQKPDLGFTTFPNVINSMQFERILSASGPFMGNVVRPSDLSKPKRIAFIQCVGSRDSKNDFCSSVCCMYAIKEAIMAKEHEEDILCDIFFMDIRAHGKGFDLFYERAQELGIQFTRCRPQQVDQIGQTGNLSIGYVDENNGAYKTKEFEMVVLSAGLRPPEDAEQIAETFGIELNTNGFAVRKPFESAASTRPGIYVTGPFAEPKDIPESVIEASSAASSVMVQLSKVRGTEVKTLELPPEMDIAGEPRRIGVFVCHCGRNIGGIVDVPSVKEYAKTLPHVVYADDNLFTCSSDTQVIIKEKIKEYNLNSVVVASCSPRTHEPLFQQTIREAGLNRYLFEMANIRDQCSWVHMHEKEAATEKSKDLVRMAVAKAGLAEPLKSIPLKVIQKALIVGGGTAGMTAALSIADQGYQVFLIEKTKTLGGIAIKIDRNIEGYDVSVFIKELIKKVLDHRLIRVYTDSGLTKVDGFIGNFTSTIRIGNGKTHEIEHGVAILAVGGLENKPDEYIYGKISSVKTLLELSEAIIDSEFEVPGTIVMIQCVGSREPDHMYCSRVCCSGAIKNAIRMKEKKPDANIFILYRDIRTYGFTEKYYTQAREMGIIFIRYNTDNKPVVTQKGESLSVKVRDHILGTDIDITADLLVLSSRINPNPDNEELSRLFKLPLNSDKFFLEAHVKLKPVEFATDGVYLCGLAHFPKNISETISQSQAAASRASTILSRDTIEAAGQISYIDESRCSSCAACVTVCAYKAITIDEERRTAVINEALCKGCGACAATCRGTAIKLHGYEDEQILKILNTV